MTLPLKYYPAKHPLIFGYKKTVMRIAVYYMPQKPEVLFTYALEEAKTDTTLRRKKGISLLYLRIKQRYDRIERERDKFRENCILAQKEMKKRAGIKGFKGEDADDLVQDCILKAFDYYEKRGFHVPVGNYRWKVSAFMCRMIDNAAMDVYRLRTKEQTDYVEDVTDVPQHQTDKDVQLKVSSALESLSASDRHIIVSLHIDKVKMFDLAKELKITLEELKCRKERIEAKMRKKTIGIYNEIR